jgi:hypothetical protein
VRVRGISGLGENKGVGVMISLLSIQDIRGHGLPGTPVSRLRERLRRGALISDCGADSALGRDLDRLAARLERVRARGGDCAGIRFSPELEQLLRERARRGVGAVRPERKRA